MSRPSTAASHPPASSDDDTIGMRTGTYLLMILLSVAVAIAAVWVGRTLVARFGNWNGVLLAVLRYMVVIGVVGALSPTVAQTPQASRRSCCTTSACPRSACMSCSGA